MLPDEDAAWQIQIAGQKLLAEAGYAQYEVSAYAGEGARCRHNLNYWLFGDYVGIGAGAHGKFSLELPQTILRTVKPKQPREYQDHDGARDCGRERATGACGDPAIGEGGFIAAADLPFEFMLNALRLNDGFSSDCYQARTGLALNEVDTPSSRSAGTAASSKPRLDGWRPTELGRRFLNDLQAEFPRLSLCTPWRALTQRGPTAHCICTRSDGLVTY